MDLSQLKTFVTVAETASLTRAASLLFLSQPAISAHIKALENEYNVKLFNRTPRGMQLTAAGHILRDEARLTLDAARNFAHKAHALNDVMNCSLGTIAAPLILNLPEVLSSLRQHYRQVNMTIRRGMSGHIIDAVINGELDAGFILGQITEPLAGVLLLAPVTLCIVAPWSWKPHLQHANWQDLPAFPWITTPEKCAYNRIASDLFAQHHITLTSATVTDEEKTLLDLVSTGIGLTLMREELALAAQHEQRIYICPLEKPVSQLCFIWSKHRESSPVISAVRNTVRELWHIAD